MRDKTKIYKDFIKPTKCQICGSKELYLVSLSSFSTGLCYDCMIKKEPKLADICICGHLRDMHRHGDWLCSPETTGEGHYVIIGFEGIYSKEFMCNCKLFINSKKQRPLTLEKMFEIVFKYKTI